MLPAARLNTSTARLAIGDGEQAMQTSRAHHFLCAQYILIQQKMPAHFDAASLSNGPKQKGRLPTSLMLPHGLAITAMPGLLFQICLD